MANWGSLCACDKGTPTHNLFLSLTSDALFWLLPGEEARVRTHCERLGMSKAQIDKLKRKYWRLRCRYACPAPRLIIRALFDIYCFFEGMSDPLKPDHTVLIDNHKAVFLKEIKCVPFNASLVSHACHV